MGLIAAESGLVVEVVDDIADWAYIDPLHGVVKSIVSEANAVALFDEFCADQRATFWHVFCDAHAAPPFARRVTDFDQTNARSAAFAV